MESIFSQFMYCLLHVNIFGKWNFRISKDQSVLITNSLKKKLFVDVAV